MVFRVLFFLVLSSLVIHPDTTYLLRKFLLYIDPLHQLTFFLYWKEVSLGLLVVIIYILLVILFNNFFCYRLCPIGFILDIFSFKKSLKTKFKVNGCLFWGLLILSLFYLNISYLFDPFVFFTQIGSLFSKKSIGFTFVYLTPLILLLLLNLFEKRFWCNRICPVGFFINSIVKLKQRFKTRKEKKEKGVEKNLSDKMLTRRNVLFGMSLLSLKFFYPKLTFKNLFSFKRALRPPGAIQSENFNDVCLKCGTCMRACPTQVLRPAKLEFGVSGLWTPLLDPKHGFCAQFCTKCGEVCPVEAIKHLTQLKKEKTIIGISSINKKTCFCHSKSILCLICYENCPYHAIKVVKNEKNFSVPLVIKEKCIGCGKCEHNCPVEPEKAIVVYNV